MCIQQAGSLKYFDRIIFKNMMHYNKLKMKSLYEKHDATKFKYFFNEIPFMFILIISFVLLLQASFFKPREYIDFVSLLTS